MKINKVYTGRCSFIEWMDPFNGPRPSLNKKRYGWCHLADQLVRRSIQRVWMIPSDAGVSLSRSCRVQQQMWIVNDVEVFESIRKQVLITCSAREHLKDWKTGIIGRSLSARWLDIVYEWNIMKLIYWNWHFSPFVRWDPDPWWSLIILGSSGFMTHGWI